MRPQFRMVPLYLGDRINRRGLLHLWLHLHRDFHLVRLYRMAHSFLTVLPDRLHRLRRKFHLAL